jgi:ketosteroid isomerase-like protein
MGATGGQLRREGLIARLASAYQRRDLAAFEPDMRPDMVLTLTGSSRLAGTYRGYEAFARYLEALRQVVRSAEERITFEHDGDEMTFHQTMVLVGPRHQVDMVLKVIVRFDDDDRVSSFTVEPQDQGLFDHVIDSTTDDPFAG